MKNSEKIKVDYQERKKNRYYYKHLGDFRQELREVIPHPILRELHQPIAWKHFSIVLRQLIWAAIAIWCILTFQSVLIWLPCSIVIGFVIFDFTVLLHEVVHNLIFVKRNPFWNNLLGWLYAIPSGISKTQFTRWHLDHHDELGSKTDDPKRAHLSPKVNKRWYKLLYMTPALIPIYFRAAATEVKTYPKHLQNQIKKERLITILIHMGLLVSLGLFLGTDYLLKIYLIPYLFVFPVAFTINRIGQHYNVDSTDIAQWSTLMKGSWFWDYVFLYSNYHLEHHYFPGIPCYNLPKTQLLLQPLYDSHHMKYQSYPKILYGWIIENKTPHTNWDDEIIVERHSNESTYTITNTPRP